MDNEAIPACYGFGAPCGKHSTCERYSAIELHPNRPRIDTCRDIRGLFPLYLHAGDAALPGEHEANGMFPFGAGL